jgi:hypothetical protein
LLVSLVLCGAMGSIYDFIIAESKVITDEAKGLYAFLVAVLALVFALTPFFLSNTLRRRVERKIEKYVKEHIRLPSLPKEETSPS